MNQPAVECRGIDKHNVVLLATMPLPTTESPQPLAVSLFLQDKSTKNAFYRWLVSFLEEKNERLTKYFVPTHMTEFSLQDTLVDICAHLSNFSTAMPPTLLEAVP
jgi:hypothetical protein